MTNSKIATEQFAQLVEDYGDECDLRGASSTRACGMFGLICDKYEKAIAATLVAGECEYKWSLADNGWADHTCSRCGHVVNTDIHVWLDYNYCPSCGSKVVKS